MRAIYLAGALSLSALAITPASAAPASPVHAQASPSALTLIQYSHDRDHDRYDRDHHRPRYVPGRRYHSAPNGWHRYDRRPGDWRHRGCVLVGPIWFCP